MLTSDIIIHLLSLWILPFQLSQGASIVNRDEEISTDESGSPNNIVYLKFYDSEKKTRSYYDRPPVSTMILKAVNATHYIELQVNEDLRDVKVQFDNELQGYQNSKNHCHFHGRIVSKPTGVVAISACLEDGKMTGVLMMEDKIYFLSPSYHHSHVNNEHYLRVCEGENAKFCSIYSGSDVKNDFQITQRKGWRNKYSDETYVKRVKRMTASTNRKVIEVAIFIDSELHKQIQVTSMMNASSATVRRVLEIMNQVQLIYNYSSLLTKFKIAVVKIIILKSIQNAPDPANGDVDKYLENFCLWQSKLNVPEGAEGHWDQAIMLTGRDLFEETRRERNARVLGLAYMNGMCLDNYSCSINEGTNFGAAFVVAHELAHSLGVKHDGNGNNCDHDKFIMSDTTGQGKLHWSACSNAYFKKFLQTGYGKCLSDEASSSFQGFNLDSKPLPGLQYSLSDQCTLALGSGFRPHKNKQEPYNNVCRELWCARDSRIKLAHPALEGSTCDNEKLCLEGLCRSAGQNIVLQSSGERLRKIQDSWIKATKNLG